MRDDRLLSIIGLVWGFVSDSNSLCFVQNVNCCIDSLALILPWKIPSLSPKLGIIEEAEKEEGGEGIVTEEVDILFAINQLFAC